MAEAPKPKPFTAKLGSTAKVAAEIGKICADTDNVLELIAKCQAVDIDVGDNGRQGHRRVIEEELSAEISLLLRRREEQNYRPPRMLRRRHQGPRQLQ